MSISIIVAASENDVIGTNNTLPWHLPADLKYFKQLTTGHTIIMGRKTFDSIGRPLPNRRNIVISRNPLFKAEGIEIIHQLDDLQELISPDEESFIIGGDLIYQQSMDLADKIYLTRVHTTIQDGSAFFAKPNLNIWEKTSSEFHPADEKNPFDYTFEVYQKSNIQQQ
ncbi:MAG: dihydrofolate reductase [Bacteroidetes bacterium]|nr:dihydrofolate reductase [Bacteroidota bacterium]